MRLIERLAPVADPVERLRRLLAEAMDDEAQGPGPADAALLASGADPLVAPVINRVQRKRLAFLEGCFRELGLPPAAAPDRARLAYSVYLGWFAQLPGAGERQPSARERAAYERAAIELLTRPRPAHPPEQAAAAVLEDPHGGVVAAGRHHAAARVRAGPAEVQAVHRRRVPGDARRRAQKASWARPCSPWKIEPPRRPKMRSRSGGASTSWCTSAPAPGACARRVEARAP